LSYYIYATAKLLSYFTMLSAFSCCVQPRIAVDVLSFWWKIELQATREKLRRRKGRSRLSETERGRGKGRGKSQLCIFYSEAEAIHNQSRLIHNFN